MSATENDLKEAFAGESQAHQKYRAWAKKAEEEGFLNIARLFRVTAEAERVHAEGQWSALGRIGATAANLEAAIAGETYEYTEMYPPMLSRAEAEKHPAKRMFGYAVKAEEIHARLYKLALEAAEKGEDLNVSEIYLCPVCGHIVFDKVPDTCPICGAKGSKYIRA